MRLIIFDFDQTLVHLHVKWNLVRQDVISEARAMGLQADEGMRLVQLSNALSQDGPMKERIDEIFLRHETECVERADYEVYPDMVALVKEVRAKGYKTAIASGNHTRTLMTVLSRIGLEFDVVCGRDMVENNKPRPDQLLLIIERLGVPKEEALFAGDSVHDEKAAEAAGIRFVRVEPGSAGSLRDLL